MLKASAISVALFFIEMKINITYRVIKILLIAILYSNAY